MLGTISMEPTYVIEGDDNITRLALMNMLEGNSTGRLMLPNLFPKFLKVKFVPRSLRIPTQRLNSIHRSRISVANWKQFHNWWITNRSTRATILSLPRKMPTETFLCKCTSRKVELGGRYWNLAKMKCIRNCSRNYRTPTVCTIWCCTHLVTNCSRKRWAVLRLAGKLELKFLPFSIWVDSWYDFVYSVIGIYTTFVFFASRLFRSIFSGGSTNIMYTELPYVDRILQLCLDIYLVSVTESIILMIHLFISHTFPISISK